jgi:hypothetical protein
MCSEQRNAVRVSIVHCSHPVRNLSGGKLPIENKALCHPVEFFPDLVVTLWRCRVGAELLPKERVGKNGGL